MKIIKLIGFLSLGLLYAFQASLPTNSPFPERQTLPTVKVLSLLFGQRLND